MTQFLAALKAIWDFIWSGIKRFFRWLRKPGSGIKLVCAVLAVALSIASLQSYQRGAELVVVTTRCATDKAGAAAAAKAREETLLSRLATYQQQERDFAKAVEAAAQRLADARAQSAAAVDQVRERQQAAERSNAAYQREAARKPDTCAAALTALEAACPTLRDY